MRADKEVGTLEEGKRADLLLLDRDPLQDPGVFADPQRIRKVMLAGELVKDLEDEVPAKVGA